MNKIKTYKHHILCGFYQETKTSNDSYVEYKEFEELQKQLDVYQKEYNSLHRSYTKAEEDKLSLLNKVKRLENIIALLAGAFLAVTVLLMQAYSKGLI